MLLDELLFYFWPSDCNNLGYFFLPSSVLFHPCLPPTILPVLFQQLPGIMRGAQMWTLSPLISTTPCHSHCCPRSRPGQRTTAPAKTEQLDPNIMELLRLTERKRKGKMCRPDDANEAVSRNTQRDETMLNQADGRHAGLLQMGPQDVLVCWTGYWRLGFQAPRRQINPHEGGRQSFSRDPTGNNEWKEGSHLQNHNRADYLWWAERKHTQKRPSAVMSPPAVRF